MSVTEKAGRIAERVRDGVTSDDTLADHAADVIEEDPSQMPRRVAEKSEEAYARARRGAKDALEDYEHRARQAYEQALDEYTERAREAYDNARQEAERRTREAYERARSEASDRARETYERAMEAAPEYAGQVADWSEETLDRMFEYIEDNLDIDEETARRWLPRILLVSGGFVAGFLVGRSLRRSREDERSPDEEADGAGVERAPRGDVPSHVRPATKMPQFAAKESHGNGHGT